MNQQHKYDVSQEPIVISKATMDILLKQRKSSNLIALYSFYYYTAKWQHTNQAKATTEYVANGLDWSIEKVQATKKELIKLKLIEDVVNKDKNTNKITGHFIKINFIWNHPPEKPVPGKTHPKYSITNNKMRLTNRVRLVRVYEEPNDEEILDREDEINRFHKPSIEMIGQYCLKRKNNIDPEEFFDFYQSKGWMVGSNKMKDWKACVRTWEQKRKKDELKNKPKASGSYDPNKKWKRADVVISNIEKQ